MILERDAEGCALAQVLAQRDLRGRVVDGLDRGDRVIRPRPLLILARKAQHLRSSRKLARSWQVLRVLKFDIAGGLTSEGVVSDLDGIDLEGAARPRLSKSNRMEVMVFVTQSVPPAVSADMSIRSAAGPVPT